VKLKLAAVEFVGFEGFAVIVVSGGVRSTVHVKTAGVGSVFPAGSVARTWNVWLPSTRLEYALGLVQAPNPPPSSWHWKELPASVDVKLKLAEVAFVGFEGFAVMEVSGAPVSTTQVWTAAEASRFPAASTARTWNVWLPAAKPV
jgi:hypothetical protein